MKRNMTILALLAALVIPAIAGAEEENLYGWLQRGTTGIQEFRSAVIATPQSGEESQVEVSDPVTVDNPVVLDEA